MRKGTIKIEVEHLSDGKYSVHIMSNMVTANMVTAACAQLLASTENTLSKEERGKFRSNFLELLNERRREVVKW